MGRRLRGAVKQTASGGWRAEVPVHIGSKKRITRTFDTVHEAEQWRDNQISRLSTGKVVPVVSTQRYPGKHVSNQADLYSISEVAKIWAEYYFVTLNRGKHSRHMSAIENLNQFIEYCELMGWKTGDDVTSDGLTSYLAWLADTRKDLVGMTKPKGKRPFKNGIGYSNQLIRLKSHDIQRMLTHGALHYGWVLEPGVIRIAVPRVDQNLQAEMREAITWKQTALLAKELHPIHQMTLWLLRVYGLRIAESQGILLKDIYYVGKEMRIDIRRQGGGGYFIRDAETGAYIPVERVDNTKTSEGFRTMVVPKQMRVLMETFISVFHPQFGKPTVAMQPFIPGLQKFNAPKTSSFYSALNVAASKRGINLAHFKEFHIDVASHDFRKSLNTDFIALEVNKDHRCLWLGQKLGDSVNEISYVMQDSELRAERKVAKELEKLISEKLPKGLMIPTHRKINSQGKKGFGFDVEAAEQSLADAGWLLLDNKKKQLLTVAEVCHELGVSKNKVQRLLRDGFLQRSRVRMDDGRIVQGIKRTSLAKYSASQSKLKTYDEVAEVLGITYSAVLYRVRAAHLEPIRDGQRVFLNSSQIRKIA